MICKSPRSWLRSCWFVLSGLWSLISKTDRFNPNYGLLLWTKYNFCQWCEIICILAFSKFFQKLQVYLRCTVDNLKTIQEFAILKTHFLSFCTFTSSFISPYSKRNINTFLLWDELPYHSRLNIVNISWVSWAIYLSAAELKRAEILFWFSLLTWTWFLKTWILIEILGN